MPKIYLEDAMTTKDLVDAIRTQYPALLIEDKADETYISVGDSVITINHTEQKFSAEGLAKVGRANIFHLTSKENFSVVMVLVKLLNKGYSIKSILLEKPFKLGHGNKYIDVFIQNKARSIVYMIEVKSNRAINDYVLLKKPDDTKQAISYAFQDSDTKIVSYYTFDFDTNKDEFYNIFIDDNLTNSKDVDDFYDLWSQIFDRTDYIKDCSIFGAKLSFKKFHNLREIQPNDTKKIFSKFSNVLRVHSVSDKPNAFIKFINLMLAKIGDEVKEDTKYNVIDENGNTQQIEGLSCQYLIGVDTPETFNLRLNKLYMDGMKDYLHKEVKGYYEERLNQYHKIKDKDFLNSLCQDLSLKSENPFSFIEIYNDDTFYDNFLILKDMVQLIEDYKFKYNYKQQFLGDFFEEMLNTSLKQEAGQFFTPMPLVDFILDAIPYEENIRKLLEDKKPLDASIPKVIDYACGSGHFLTSSMVRVQNAINDIAKDTSLELTSGQTSDLGICSREDNQYSWVKETNVVGIEKDYRLAKTTKITTYLHGDGRAAILNADGINKFDCKDYIGTPLYQEKPSRKYPSHSIECFDYVISNPPYSVEGFVKNLHKNKIEKDDGTFSLFDDSYSEKDARIENMFMERTYQLLKPNGLAAIVLPQSILTSDKYLEMRNFVFKYFKVIGMLLTSDLSFAGTTTSPVVLFLQKLETPNTSIKLDYEVVVIGSPKYRYPKKKKVSDIEKQFLGYKFSANRNNSGIELLNNPGLAKLSGYIKNAFLGLPNTIQAKDSEYVSILKLDDICILDKNGNKMIYPKYNNKVSGNPISYYGKVNERTVTATFNPTKYIEIGNIVDGRVEYTGNKSKTSSRLCKKGDILISSLCPTADKIAIADDDYMVTPAIHVLEINPAYDVNDILKKLRSDNVLEQMNNLLDGFKITYAKINDTNLKNYIKI